MSGRFVCPNCAREVSAEEFEAMASAAGLLRADPVELLCNCDDEIRMEWREEPER